jgi:hypothetical protein
LNAYRTYLKIKLEKGPIVTPEDRKECLSFRKANKISDEEHSVLLRKLGWVLEGIFYISKTAPRDFTILN